MEKESRISSLKENIQIEEKQKAEKLRNELSGVKRDYHILIK